MSAPSADDDRLWMARAIGLARRGEGRVEPNPMVGCVLVRDGGVVGEGWHQQFGGPHAEIEALRDAGEAARGATAYVTLEPCCHVGKTPPCTQALIAAGIGRVVAGVADPNPLVNGAGLAQLQAAGIEVMTGVLGEEARDLIAPFAKFAVERRPWIIAKWAMTLDGKLATHAGDSRWISGEASRQIVHALRGRADGVLVGRGTAERDDPLLTARPPGPRRAVRIVLDSAASLSLDGQLVRTAAETPVLVAASRAAPAEKVNRLRAAAVEVWQSAAVEPDARLRDLLEELGRRQMTNLLVEGGSRVFGSLFDLGAIDEVHAFIAPRIVGGPAPTPVAGRGVASIFSAMSLIRRRCETVGDDLYVHGRVLRTNDS